MAVDEDCILTVGRWLRLQLSCLNGLMVQSKASRGRGMAWNALWLVISPHSTITSILCWRKPGTASLIIAYYVQL